MGLNLNATRRLSLNGFAIGWDDCYLLVKAVKQEEAQATSDEIEKLKESNDVQGLNALVRDYCVRNITGGSVINTLEDGTTERVEISRDDVPTVVDVLNTAWQLEVLAISTGSDRLK